MRDTTVGVNITRYDINAVREQSQLVLGEIQSDGEPIDDERLEYEINRLILDPQDNIVCEVSDGVVTLRTIETSLQEHLPDLSWDIQL